MREKLRVAAVVSYFPTSAEPNNGMPLFNQVRPMSALADLTIYVVRPQYPASRLLHPNGFIHQRCDTKYSIPGLDVKYITYPVLPVLTRPFNGWICAERLVSAVREKAPDVILSYIVYPEGNAAVRVARKLNLPVVVGATGSDVRCIGDPWTRLLVKQTLRKADMVVTKSHELRDQVIQLGATPDNVRAVLNGCDGEIFRLRERDAARNNLGIGRDVKLVMFTGRLVEVKGLRELIDAIGMVRRAGQTVELALIGYGPLETELRARARAQGIGEAVRFTGAQSQHEVAQWLAAANVFCLPSYSEGCPNVILEALSCGRPVVASNVGGVPEIVDSACAILVPPADSEALAHGIQDALARSWDERAIVASHRRSWTEMARETLSVCSDAIARKRHPAGITAKVTAA